MAYQLKDIYCQRFAFKIKLMGKIKTNFDWVTIYFMQAQLWHFSNI